jgi:ribosomal protein S18 acetylase RimI-like enzyme
MNKPIKKSVFEKLTVTIRCADENDIDNLLKTFSRWHKSRQRFLDYLEKQKKDENIFIVALMNKNTVTAYGNLFLNSRIDFHRAEGIPEIVDLNVMTEYQQKGIGTQMINWFETFAKERGLSAIGIAVEPTKEYASANRLYHELGYKDDGEFILPNGEEVLVLKKIF